MPAWCGLLGVLAYNYRRHRRGLPTICATARRLLPRLLADALVVVVFAWLLGHIHNGYPKESR